MRSSLVAIALVVSLATNAQAQNSWQNEFGIQGGFTRIVLAGAGGDPTDVISLPGFNLGSLIPSAAGLYFTIPASRKLAVETDVAFSQFSSGLTATLLTLGVRGDYAVTRHLYGAAGGALAYNNGIANATQLGVQAGLGYRFGLSRTLNGRFEARTTFYAKTDNTAPVNAYSALFGVSTVTSRPRSARSSSAASAHRAWRPALGISGGYASVTAIGTGTLAALALPGYGSALSASLIPEVTLPPTIFAIIPVGNKIAVEPALDIHRFQESGTTSFSGNVAARLNYAVHGGWYGALGGNLQYIKQTGASAATRTGVNLGWGYRFPLVAALGGRFEANYTMFGKNTDLGLVPTNTFGLMFGVTMPLK
ncbi:MAG TPA: hypothetical protein VN513_12565 [Gemmatimonadales bacterium]|nr:hypothetical protein [Gemmatimonadales bacterium]HYV97127.1 hypothetical protein [Gemmatimonadaceae bacterium]